MKGNGRFSASFRSSATFVFTLMSLCCGISLLSRAGSNHCQEKPVVTTKPPAIGLNQEDGAKAAFIVKDIAPEDLAALAKVQWETPQWAVLFTVSVIGDKNGAKNPPILGSYHVDVEGLRFEPRFPLTPGLRYRAIFNPSQLPGAAKREGKPIQARFDLPKPQVESTTVVEQVYPTANKLPENQLKFYVHFSAPMSRGEAYERIRLLDAAGKAIDHPFLELDEELWDPRGRRFTVFFHPGRVKRGLKPREEQGPILEEGKTYTLVIDRQWNDARGNPLKESFRKTFQASAPDDQTLDPKTWKIHAPPAGTTEPLTVRFPKPLDHALLERMLWVSAAENRKVAGTLRVAEEEKVWRFTPAHPWQAGAYHLVADTRLEDLAGNSIARPFEVDVFHRVQREVKAETVRVAFQVK